MVTIASDTFTRANQSGWGTASDTETYFTTFGSPTLSIVSNKGQLTGASSTCLILFGTGYLNNADYLVRFSVSANTFDQGVMFAYHDGNNFCDIACHNNSLSINKTVSNTRTTIAVVATVGITASTLYWMHLHVSGTTASVNVWADGGSEPGGFQVSGTDNVIKVSGAFGYRVVPTVTSQIVTYDSFTATSTPTNYYVSPTGNDGNPGTQALPFLTLNQAQSFVAAGSTGHVAAGTYPVGTSFTSNPGGTPVAPITWISDTLHGAVIVATGPSTVWFNHGDYVTVDSFELYSTNTACGVGVSNSASNCIVQNCIIHEIRAIGQGSNGGAGILHTGFTTPNNNSFNNKIYNIGSVTDPNSNLVQGIYHSGPGGKCQNNEVYQVTGFGVQLWHGANNNNIENNLIFKCGLSGSTGGIVVGAVTGQGAGINDNTIVANNIIRDCTGYAIVELGVTGTHNQYLDNCEYNNTGQPPIQLQNGLTDSGTVHADPQFVNYQTDGSGDYHLTAASPCINAGTSTGAPTTDKDGTLRSLKSGRDIGPYLYFPIAIFPTANRRSGVFPTANRRSGLFPATKRRGE